MSEKILIVDDDQELRSELHDLLEGYDIVEASSGEMALGLLKKANEIGLVILDIMMDGISGLEVLTEIRKLEPRPYVVILTGHSSKDIAIEALKGHADDYIEKPVEIHRIKDTVGRLMEARFGQADINSLDLSGKIDKVKRFIERNCFKKVTLKEAAEAACLSPKYLSRVFKEHMKKGFSEFKLSLKIEKAKELLSKSGLNINQVSEKLGYENTESFIRQFKILTGSTPTRYRDKIRKKKKAANAGRKKSRKNKRK